MAAASLIEYVKFLTYELVKFLSAQIVGLTFCQRDQSPNKLRKSPIFNMADIFNNLCDECYINHSSFNNINKALSELCCGRIWS